MSTLRLSLLAFLCSSLVAAQSLVSVLNQEHDPAKRFERALSLADESFDQARGFYQKGSTEKGDAALETMTGALDACVQSLAVSNKAKFYKRAELEIALLQRRMTGLLDEISMTERGWADQTNRKLEEIHDKVLEGVMRK